MTIQAVLRLAQRTQGVAGKLLYNSRISLPPSARSAIAILSREKVSVASARIPVALRQHALQKWDEMQLDGDNPRSVILPPEELALLSAEFMQLLNQEKDSDPDALSLLKAITQFRTREAVVLETQGSMPQTDDVDSHAMLNPSLIFSAYQTPQDRLSYSQIMRYIRQNELNILYAQMILHLCGYQTDRLDEKGLFQLSVVTSTSKQDFHTDGQPSEIDPQGSAIKSAFAANALFLVESTQSIPSSTDFIAIQDVAKYLTPSEIAILQEPVFYSPSLSGKIVGYKNPHSILYQNEEGRHCVMLPAGDVTSASRDRKYFDALRKLKESIAKVEASPDMHQVKLATDSKQPDSVVLFHNDEILHRRGDLLSEGRRSLFSIGAGHHGATRT